MTWQADLEQLVEAEANRRLAPQRLELAREVIDVLFQILQRYATKESA